MNDDDDNHDEFVVVLLNRKEIMSIFFMIGESKGKITTRSAAAVCYVPSSNAALKQNGMRHRERGCIMCTQCS